MRAACKATTTYPNAMHYMRLNISRLISHSNRVAAATTALCTVVGLAIEDINHWLRWKATSVETYLRECCYYRSIGELTQKATTGAADLAAQAT